MKNILLIDDQWGRRDDPMIPDLYGKLPYRFLLESAREEDGCFTVAAAMRRLEQEMPDVEVLLLDIMFGPEMEPLGIPILEQARGAMPILPILIFTSLESENNRETVIKCMELGANEYIVKAPPAERMKRILDVYAAPESDMALYGNSPAIRRLRAEIARVAFKSAVPVLIVGESGTGKELIARALYRQGPKRDGAFVAKNCAHSDSQLLDSELFGHEQGAFTGAIEDRVGLLEEANGGVLFLDEIADMPPNLQAKLLRAVENRTFRRVGGNADLTSDFQLICATNRDPRQLLSEGKFREDLFYRVSTITLQAPPLREHLDDIPIYVDLFIKKFQSRGGASYPGERFSAQAMKHLMKNKWPGNIRELRNAVERAVILSQSATIGTECLTPEIAAGGKRGGETAPSTVLPEEASLWPRQRVIGELKMALEAKKRIQSYKGRQWRAEFMRMMYPECRAQSAKGFNDVIRRLTSGPWGYPHYREDEEMKELLGSLQD